MPGRSRLVASALLFTSGVTGLVYELAWSKRLGNLLGSSGHAHALVLATFMGGLALGAAVFGRAADRSKRPLALYGWLELGVGLGALVVPTVLDAAGGAWLSWAAGWSSSTRTLSRLPVAMAVLLPPTLLMGGALPALVRALSGSLGAARVELPRLYALNALGAALGCLVAGFWWIPEWGLTTAERAAAACNVVVGVVAIAIARGRSEAPPGEAGPRGEELGSPTAVKVALWGTAVSGFTSMLYETTWIRVLSIVIGGTSYAFTLILAAFIVGIGLGGFWLSRQPSRGLLARFGALQLALVVAICAVLPLYERLPWAFLSLQGLLRPSEGGFVLFQLASFGFCAALLVAPAFLLGASFPAAARVVLSSVSSAGRDLGRVSLWNTTGTVTGALLGGLWVLPVLGLERAFVLGLVLNFSVGAVAWLLGAERTRRRVAVVAGVLVALVAYAGGARGWSERVASAGRWREWERTFASYAEFRAAADARGAILFQRDDVFASVLVGDTGHGLRYMRINGKVDASNGSDVDTQVLAGQLGLLLHQGQPKRVLLIGLGAGITAGTLLSHPIERLDVVEISPAVIDAARLFDVDHRRALDDPRLVLHVEDAKSFLALSRVDYDLIVSVPSNPWVSGVAGLFSRDFFQVAKQRLAPGGRLVQWFHAYESSDELVRLVVRTLRDTFPHATGWVGPQDLVMVAGREPTVIDPEAIAERMASPRVQAELARAGSDRLSTLLARQVHSEAGLAALAGSGDVNTDDLNRLEYRSAQAYFRGALVDLHDERREKPEALALHGWLDEHPLDVEGARALHACLLAVHGPADPLVRSAAAAWSARAPNDELAALAVAKAQLAQRAPEAAIATLERFVVVSTAAPDTVATWLDAHLRVAKRESAPWSRVNLEAPLGRARACLAANPSHSELSRVIAAASK